VIAELLPPTVMTAEAFGAPARTRLFPGEDAAVATADPARQAEFAAGRACARAALARLGVPPGPVLPGRAGEPQWPPGVVGSLTHCPGYRACAVAGAGDVAGIGIDAEPCRALPAGLLAVVATGRERRQLAELAAASAGVPWDLLLFCGKEAAYKAWFPLTGRRLRWASVLVAITTGGFTAEVAGGFTAEVAGGDTAEVAGGFTAEVARGDTAEAARGDTAEVAGAPGRGGDVVTCLTGRWMIRDGLVVTAALVRRGGEASAAGRTARA
jgi:4'-phosphopantetheinyl transferase EntD